MAMLADLLLFINGALYRYDTTGKTTLLYPEPLPGFDAQQGPDGRLYISDPDTTFTEKPSPRASAWRSEHCPCCTEPVATDVRRWVEIRTNDLPASSRRRLRGGLKHAN